MADVVFTLLGLGGRRGEVRKECEINLMNFRSLENCITSVLGSYFQVHEQREGDCQCAMWI